MITGYESGAILCVENTLAARPAKDLIGQGGQPTNARAV